MRRHLAAAVRKYCILLLTNKTLISYCREIQEGLAVTSTARDDPSTLPGDDPFSRARMHRDRKAR